jgi:energy-coupling factor transporter ATP-binding protein EcfA2
MQGSSSMTSLNGLDVAGGFGVYKLNSSSENFNSETVNLDELEDLFKKSSNQILKLKGKDIVLVVGNTGSGKSTVINYLLGNEMKKIMNKGSRVYVGVTEDESLYPKIGLRSLSETLYSSIYHDSNNDIYWCDCAGFGENRGLVEEILADINLEIAIRLSNSVIAIIIVINSHELDVKKGVALSQLNQKLASIIKSFEDVVESVLFVFTKIDDNEMVVGDLIEQIQQKIEDQASLKQKSKSSWDISELDDKSNSMEKCLHMLKLMSENEDKFFIMNYTTNKVRQEIIDHVLSLKQAILKSNFEFETNNNLRLKFNQFVFKVAHEGTCLIESRNDLNKFIHRSNNELQRLSERISFYENENNMLSNNSSNNEGIMKNSTIDEETSNESKMIIEKIKSNEALKLAEQTRLAPIIDEINLIERELSKQNSNEIVLYWKDSVLEKRLKINILGQTICFGRTYKVFSYKDIPYEKVEYHKENGTFEIKEDDKVSGRFKAIYVSNTKEDGLAWVKIYVKKKNKTDVKYLIGRIQDKLHKKKMEKLKYESIISKLDEEIKQFQTIQKNLKTSNNISIISQKNSNEIELKSCKTRTEILRDEISNAANSLICCEGKIESKKHLFQMISLISETMDFSSLLLVEEFLKLKLDYIDNNEIRLDYDCEFPDDFKCPISQEVMDDPV